MRKNYKKKSTEELKKEREELLSQSQEYLSNLAEAVMNEENVHIVTDFFRVRAQCNKYSSNNFALVMREDMYRNGEVTVTNLAPFNYWTKLKNDDGESVSINKGSKGYPVLVPVHVIRYEYDEKTNKPVLNAKGKKIPARDENGEIIKKLTFKKGSVFDISQTNAREIGAWQDLDILPGGEEIPQELFERIKNTIGEKYNFEIICEPLSNPGDPEGYCIPAKGEIHLNSDLTYDSQLAVLFHEVGHGIMHTDDALKNREKESISYEDLHTAERKDLELEAESFSYSLCHACGIEPASELYLLNWQGNKSEDAKEALVERIDYLSKSITDFSQKVDLKGIIYEYNYEQEYPLHYKYSNITSIDTLNLDDFEAIDIFKTDNNGRSLEKLIDKQLATISPESKVTLSAFMQSKGLDPKEEAKKCQTSTKNMSRQIEMTH